MGILPLRVWMVLILFGFKAAMQGSESVGAMVFVACCPSDVQAPMNCSALPRFCGFFRQEDLDPLERPLRFKRISESMCDEVPMSTLLFLCIETNLHCGLDMSTTKK